MPDSAAIVEAGGGPVSSLEQILYAADWVLFVLGGVVVLGTAGLWVIRSRRDPLRESGIRDNRLSVEGLLVPVLVWLSAGSFLALVTGLSSAVDPSPAVMIFVGNAAQLCGACAGVWAAGRCFAGRTAGFLFGRRRIAPQAGRATFVFSAALTICACVYFLTGYLISLVEPNYRVFDHQVIDALRDGEAPLWAFWIGTSVVAPICEEIFFRGLLISFLVNALKSRWSAVVLSALLFGAVHAGGGETPQPHVVPALTAFAVLLGAYYVRTGSLVGPIVAHALFNAKTLLWETLASGGA